MTLLMGAQREQENRRNVLHKLNGHKILKKASANDRRACVRTWATNFLNQVFCHILQEFYKQFINFNLSFTQI